MNAHNHLGDGNRYSLFPCYFDHDQSDTLARAQAKAAEACDHLQVMFTYTCPKCGERVERAGTEKFLDTRRCLFGHSVPANQGYSTKAGFVCTAHSSSFDND